jgi:acyl-coenzyme A synthetase/AMP-(fatty) acid ligase
MSKPIPLIAHPSAGAAFAYRGGRVITAGQYLADVGRLASMLPAGGHVVNLCADRYRFAVGLGAAMTSGKISLLPPTQVPEIIRHLHAFAPDALCLNDDPGCAVDLPRVCYPPNFAPPTRWEVPRIAAAQCVAHVFTSGTTGAPVPHVKTWAKLVANVRIEAERMGLTDGRRHALIATVPAQHMYGFESSVLVAMQSGQAFAAERPFYPADIAAVLQQAPAPRVLVTTPIHLRSLLAGALAMPAVELILCATAPLDLELARLAVRRFDAPLLEIYGATETGQIASRRPIESPRWQLWPGVELTARDGGTIAAGGHVEVPTRLGDVIESQGDGRFLLHGRIEDLVNVAGKRNSIAHLNHHLNAMPGIVDGAFFVREEGEANFSTMRLGAVVVAPGLTAAAILTHLSERVDAVFLPRPLVFVDTVPRNATGKLTKAALEALTARR